jgi:von Willebrand factor A domain-containing protein 8
VDAYSPLVQGAWAGRLVHFSGLDVLGPTAGAIARLLQDREVELWEGKRIVASLEDDEVRASRFPAFSPFTLSSLDEPGSLCRPPLLPRR